MYSRLTKPLGQPEEQRPSWSKSGPIRQLRLYRSSVVPQDGTGSTISSLGSSHTPNRETSMREISHDPYARQTLVSRRVEVQKNQTCQWCGRIGANKHRNGMVKSLYLIQYGMEYDDSEKTDWMDQMFCSVGCMRAYTG